VRNIEKNLKNKNKIKEKEAGIYLAFFKKTDII
jgi:hypothetical protein